MILWFRNDLRLHDNPVIDWATNYIDNSENTIEVLPVYCFDPRTYSKASETRFETRRIGIVRS